MSRSLKCLIRKVGHAFLVGSEYIAVSYGMLYSQDVDRSRFVCKLPGDDDNRDNDNH